MKLALFGGTFDPVHIGHLILARQALEELGVDQVILIPAAASPFKDGQTETAASHRLNMVKLAIDGENGFAVDPIEVERGGPSYAIETVRAYRNRYPEAELLFLIGEDHVSALPTWHRYPELTQLVTFVVLSRSDDGEKAGFKMIQRRLDLSATEIRNRVAHRQSIKYLVPEKVLRYINDTNLYRGDPLSEPRS